MHNAKNAPVHTIRTKEEWFSTLYHVFFSFLSCTANGLYNLSYDDSMVVLLAVDYEYACSFISYFSFSLSRQGVCWEPFLWFTSFPFLLAPALAGFFVALIIAVFSISASSSSSLLAVHFLQAHSSLPPLSCRPLPLHSLRLSLLYCNVCSKTTETYKKYLIWNVLRESDLFAGCRVH